MNSGIVLAILCLFFSGLNDFIFKKHSFKASQSVGLYVSMIGFFWFIFQMTFYFVTGRINNFAINPVLYSIIPGVLLLFSNILFIESMTVLDASLGSTVYRLNTVPAIVLSVLFLNDSLSFLRFLGAFFSVAAVILLFEKQEKSAAGKYLLFVMVCISASVLRALFAFASKYLMLNGVENQIINAVSALTWFFGGAVYALIRDKKICLRSINLRYPLISGFFIFVVAALLFNAINKGNLSIIIPISNMGFLVAYLLAGIAGIEKFSLKKNIALLIAVIAIILLSLS